MSSLPFQSDIVVSVTFDKNENIVNKVSNLSRILDFAKETENLKNIFYDSRSNTLKIHFKNSATSTELEFCKEKIKEVLGNSQYSLN